jgi:hypothetical protein
MIATTPRRALPAFACAAALALALAACSPAASDAAPTPAAVASSSPTAPSDSAAGESDADCEAVRATHADFRAPLSEALVVLEPTDSVASDVWPEYDAALADVRPTLTDPAVGEAVETLRQDIAQLPAAASDPEAARDAINAVGGSYNALDALCR